MREQNYAFKTIEQTSDVELYKNKGSKFYAYAFPIQKETDVKKHIEKLKEKHRSAGHFCYAFFYSQLMRNYGGLQTKTKRFTLQSFR